MPGKLKPPQVQNEIVPGFQNGSTMALSAGRWVCIHLLPFGSCNLPSEIGVITQARYRYEKFCHYLEYGTNKCCTEQDQIQADTYPKSGPGNTDKIKYIEEETASIYVTESS